MFNGLDKKYSEGSKKDIREYTDFGRAKLMISCLSRHPPEMFAYQPPQSLGRADKAYPGTGRSGIRNIESPQ
jgi:hypothetical protein